MTVSPTVGVSLVPSLATGAAGGAQAYSAELDALAAVSGTGYIAQTASNTVALRTFSGPGDVILINPAGVAGNTVFTAPWAGGQKLLAKLIGAALNSTADQALTMAPALAKYIITSIIFTNASGTPLLAAGTIYTAASKGGIALFGSALTVYTGLTSATKFASQTLVTALTTDTQTASPLYFSLTTANSAAVTCDILIFGQDLS